MLVLGIETSCDETAVALYEGEEAVLLAEAVHSQAPQHDSYGGVVPELASREHVRRLAPLINQVLEEARTPLPCVEGIAYTAGPGLVGSLLVGASFASALARSAGVPALGVHHMEAHLLAAQLGENPVPEFPFLCLLVSGGHSLLVMVDAPGRYRPLGETIDDAAGEAIDKTAKLLGLPYPGGPSLEILAGKGDEEAFSLPRPLLGRKGFDFSFSGLKTAVRRLMLKLAPAEGELTDQVRADIAASFQAAVFDCLAGQTLKAARSLSAKRLVVAGGVAANGRLRRRFAAAAGDLEIFFPPCRYCTDNAAMIALTGSLRLSAGERSEGDFFVHPRWPLGDLTPFSAR